MPVIRRDPAPGPPPSPSTQGGPSPATQTGRVPTSDGLPHPGSRYPPLSPPVDAKAIAAKALEEVRAALAEQHLRTQTRVVRGLEALDQRDIERQRTTQESFEAGFREVSAKVDELRQGIYMIDRSARRQIDELTARLDSALDGMVEVLGYMKSEIAAIHYSLDASGTEARMQSESSRSSEEDSF